MPNIMLLTLLILFLLCCGIVAFVIIWMKSRRKVRRIPTILDQVLPALDFTVSRLGSGGKWTGYVNGFQTTVLDLASIPGGVRPGMTTARSPASAAVFRIHVQHTPVEAGTGKVLFSVDQDNACSLFADTALSSVLQRLAQPPAVLPFSVTESDIQIRLAPQAVTAENLPRVLEDLSLLAKTLKLSGLI